MSGTVIAAITAKQPNNISIENYSIIKNNLNNNAMSHYAETNRLISSLATMVMQEKHEQKDPFWNESAKNLLEGIIGFFLEEYKLGNIKREKITISINDVVVSYEADPFGIKNVNDLVQELNRKGLLTSLF